MHEKNLGTLDWHKWGHHNPFVSDRISNPNFTIFQMAGSWVYQLFSLYLVKISSLWGREFQRATIVFWHRDSGKLWGLYQIHVLKPLVIENQEEQQAFADLIDEEKFSHLHRNHTWTFKELLCMILQKSTMFSLNFDFEAMP